MPTNFLGREMGEARGREVAGRDFIRINGEDPSSDRLLPAASKPSRGAALTTRNRREQIKLALYT